jgi:hypothetical protein
MIPVNAEHCSDAPQKTTPMSSWLYMAATAELGVLHAGGAQGTRAAPQDRTCDIMFTSADMHMLVGRAGWCEALLRCAKLRGARR